MYTCMKNKGTEILPIWKEIVTELIPIMSFVCRFLWNKRLIVMGLQSAENHFLSGTGPENELNISLLHKTFV